MSLLRAPRSRSKVSAPESDPDRLAVPDGGKSKVVVVMPARQAAATLEQTFAGIPKEAVDEVILVDDHSTDETVELARGFPSTWSGTRTASATARTRRLATWRLCSAMPTSS